MSWRCFQNTVRQFPYQSKEEFIHVEVHVADAITDDAAWNMQMKEQNQKLVVYPDYYDEGLALLLQEHQ